VLRFFAYSDSYKKFEHDVANFLDDYNRLLAAAIAVGDGPARALEVLTGKTSTIGVKFFRSRPSPRQRGVIKNAV
jgi:hypothetical protein